MGVFEYSSPPRGQDALASNLCPFFWRAEVNRRRGSSENPRVPSRIMKMALAVKRVNNDNVNSAPVGESSWSGDGCHFFLAGFGSSWLMTRVTEVSFECKTGWPSIIIFLARIRSWSVFSLPAEWEMSWELRLLQMSWDEEFELELGYVCGSPRSIFLLDVFCNLFKDSFLIQLL